MPSSYRLPRGLRPCVQRGGESLLHLLWGVPMRSVPICRGESSAGAAAAHGGLRGDGRHRLRWGKPCAAYAAGIRVCMGDDAAAGRNGCGRDVSAGRSRLSAMGGACGGGAGQCGFARAYGAEKCAEGCADRAALHPVRRVRRAVPRGGGYRQCAGGTAEQSAGDRGGKKDAQGKGKRQEAAARTVYVGGRTGRAACVSARSGPDQRQDVRCLHRGIRRAAVRRGLWIDTGEVHGK